MGLECEGVSEIFETMLNTFGRPSRVPLYDASFAALQDSQDIRSRLMSYVLVTGGNTLVNGFDHRIKCELQMLNQTGTQINVVRALDAQIDAWRGGALLAQSYFNK